MKLYYSKGSCSLAIRIIINELGLACEFESVDLKTKKTESGQDFLKINAKGSVPVLITDDEKTLTENSVIQQYIADTNQANQLLPTFGDFKRYQVLETLNFISTDLHKGFSPLFNQHIPQEIKEKIFIPLIKAKILLLEKQLNQKKYLFGDSFTLPDAYLYVILNWAIHLNFDISQWPNIARYFNELQKRKSIQQSLNEEGLKYALA